MQVKNDKYILVSTNLYSVSCFIYIISSYCGQAGTQPWVVTVSGGGQPCAGTLVSSKHVVTAAQCVLATPPGQLEVKLRDGSSLSVAQINIHEDFTIFSYENDVAIIQLRKHIDLTEHTPACLPRAVTGQNVEARKSEEVFLEVHADVHTILDKNACIRAMAEEGGTEISFEDMSDSVLCAPICVQDTCQVLSCCL